MGQGVRSGELPVSSERFNHTRWSLAAAVREGDAAGRDPLAELSGSYWFPVYACVRGHGYPPDAAWRLTRGFFD